MHRANQSHKLITLRHSLLSIHLSAYVIREMEQNDLLLYSSVGTLVSSRIHGASFHVTSVSQEQATNLLTNLCVSLSV